MTLRISDLLDCVQDDTVVLRERDAVSSQRILDKTMAKLRAEGFPAPAAKRGRRRGLTAVIAAAACLALAVTAYVSGLVGLPGQTEAARVSPTMPPAAAAPMEAPVSAGEPDTPEAAPEPDDAPEQSGPERRETISSQVPADSGGDGGGADTTETATLPEPETEPCYDGPDDPLSGQVYSTDPPDYGDPEPKIEVCCEDPDNPLSEQNYSVGPPNYE